MTPGPAPGRAADPVRTVFFGSGAFAVPLFEARARPSPAGARGGRDSPGPARGPRQAPSPDTGGPARPHDVGTAAPAEPASRRDGRRGRGRRFDPSSACSRTTARSCHPRSSPCRRMGSSTSTRRCCRGTAERHRSRRRSRAATPERVSRSSGWTTALTRARSSPRRRSALDGTETGPDLEARGRCRGRRVVQPDDRRLARRPARGDATGRGDGRRRARRR